MKRRFVQLDVFGTAALGGNPLAVVLDAHGLDDATMAAFARWTNLSETTFVLPPTQPEADYRVRIFGPGGELPFAGHPTLGTCHAWVEAGGRPRDGVRVVQQCALGQVPVRRLEDGWAFAAPPLQVKPVADACLREVVQALRLPRERVQAAAWLEAGVPRLALELDHARSVLALQPDTQALKRLCRVGAIGRHDAGADSDFEVRYFAAPVGIAEDPVTGSFNAAVAQWLITAGRAPRRYVAAQGRCVGRAGRLVIEHDGSDCWVGGAVRPCISAVLEL